MSTPFLLTIPADLVVLGIGVKLAAVVFPTALPLTVRSATNALLGVVTRKPKQLLAVATTMSHQTAPNRDASRLL